MDTKISNRVTLAIIALAAVSRLLPHPPNVTPLTAIALLAGATFTASRAYLIALAALALSDLFLGWHPTIPFVYACFLATATMGLWLKSGRGPARIAGLCLASTALFFVVTNFGVWLLSGMYARDLAGLAACYTAAIPFLRNSLLGDAAFTALLFGLDRLSVRALVPQTA